MRTSIIVVIGLIGSGSQASDPPYAGRWISSAAKTELGRRTIVYEELAGAGLRISAGGVTYTVTLDGRPTPTPWGHTDSWTKVGAVAWEVIIQDGNHTLSTDTLRLSSDGNLLTRTYHSSSTQGTVAPVQYRRVSGGAGLAGEWQTSNDGSIAPGALEIVAQGTEGLSFKDVDAGTMCVARFDGKDYPLTRGGTTASGWTCTIARVGERAFVFTTKMDRKPIYAATLTVSADGKTLTREGGSLAASERVRVVYDRQ